MKRGGGSGTWSGGHNADWPETEPCEFVLVDVLSVTLFEKIRYEK